MDNEKKTHLTEEMEIQDSMASKPTYSQLVKQNSNLAEQFNLVIEKYNALKAAHKQSLQRIAELEKEIHALQKARSIFAED